MEERTFRLDYPELRRQDLISRSGRHAPLAAQFGHARRQLMRELQIFAEARGNTSGRRVLVTSAHPGEGKTFTVLNLALSTVLEERRSVVLIDADYVRRNLGERLGLPIVRDGNPVLYRAEDVPLHVLPAFLTPTQTISSEGRQLLIEVLDEVGGRHPDALLLIDTPPLQALTDAAFVGQVVDHVVIVVGAGATTPEDIENCMDLIGRAEQTSLLLNRARSGSERNANYKDYEAYRAYQREA
jgi:Mrp family chromosome partitioning ATPase